MVNKTDILTFVFITRADGKLITSGISRIQA